ncbi:MAG: hypothetical protein J0L96_10275 [Anaerolineae bacterium]|nr:hypothetical protein [Anaerolineae bacterium]
MRILPLTDEVKTEIDEALTNLNSPLQLGESKLISYNTAIKYQQENVTTLPYQALKAVLTDILERLEIENPVYADILRGRFWEGLSPNDMIVKERPKRWAEKTFYNYQRKAKNEFYFLFWQREQSLRQSAQLNSLVNSEEARENIKNKSNLSRRLIFNSLWAYMFLVVFAFAVAALFFIVSNNKTKPSEQILVPTSTSVTLTPITSDITSTPVNQNTFCGETEQIPLDFGIPRFVRSQGISNFNIENTPGILSNAVRALAIDQTGLWIGYFNSDKSLLGNIGHYDKKSFAICGISNIVEAQNINTIAISPSGKIWVGTEKNGVLLFDGQKWNRYTTLDGLPSDEIFALTVDSQDNLWVGTWEGVAKFDGVNWSVPYQVQNDTIYNNHISSIEFDSQQNIWIGHIRDGVSEYRQVDSKWIYYTTLTENGLAGDQIRDIMIRPKSEGQLESVWFATADGGISRFEQGNWTTYRTEDGLPSNDVSALTLDRYNRIWAATAKGVAYFDDKIWKIYHTLPATTIAIGSRCTDASCLFDEDHVWTGTLEMGLTHSRIPLPDPVLKVMSICFVTSQRERICPSYSFDDSLPVPVVTAVYPSPLKSDDTLRFEITVSPEGTYELREDRGDFMSNMDDNDFNLFGAWPVIGVKGAIETGQPYTFTDYDNPFMAPSLPEGIQEKQFISTWRMWMHTRYVGPVIQLVFTVKK